MLVLLTVFALAAALAFAGIPASTVLAQGPGGTSGSGGSGGSGSGGTGAGGTTGTGASGANGANGANGARNFNGVAPNAANSVLLSSNESSSFIGAGTAAPAGAFGVGVFFANGFQTYTIDTRAGLNLSCAAVRVYRVTEMGDLILHPSTCSGDMLSFVSAGTGHYVLYAFGNTNGAQGAQNDVIRSQNGINNNNQNSANNNQSGVNNNSQSGINNGAGGTSGQNAAGSNQSGVNNNSQNGINNNGAGGTNGQNAAGSNQSGLNNNQASANSSQSGINNNSQNGANNNQSNSPMLSQNESAGMMSFWQNSSVGGRVMGVVLAQGYTQYSINTRASGNASCGFVSVYRVTESGALIRHPSTCAGDMLTFTSVGTGHYVLFSFGSANGAQNSAQSGFSAGGSTGSSANSSSSSNGTSGSSNSSSAGGTSGSSSSSSMSGTGTSGTTGSSSTGTSGTGTNP